MLRQKLIGWIRKGVSYITWYHDPKYDRRSVLQDEETGYEESFQQNQ